MVENIEKPRQPYPSYEAVYILTPCIESCTRLVDDFSRKDGPMYAAAHVHFINGIVLYMTARGRDDNMYK